MPSSAAAPRDRAAVLLVDDRPENLLAEVERALHAAIDTAATGGQAEGAAADQAERSADAVQAAARYAADVTHHVLEQATRTALRAFRFANAADTS
jgi:hypothetical protein